MIDTTAVPPASAGPDHGKTVGVPAKRKAYPERVAERAEQIRFGRVLLMVLAAPFYVVGLLVGVVWVAFRWCVAATAEGVADVRRRARPEVSDDGAG